MNALRLIIASIVVSTAQALLPHGTEEAEQRNNGTLSLKALIESEEWREALQQQTQLEEARPLNRSGSGLSLICDSTAPSPTIPSSVHKLRPADVKVVAAVGDSITAGFGESATNVLNLVGEWRGRSWSIGGEKPLSELATLPSILREFNPKVHGAATGKGGANSKEAKFNLAVSGAIAEDMPGQVRNLVKRMKEDSAVDYQTDWKVVTLWIGGNDLCAVCKGNERHEPTKYVGYIEEALDYLQAEMPRTFVNLVYMLEVTQLYALDSLSCQLFHGVECPCGTSNDASKREQTKAAALEYQKLTAQLATQAKWQSKEDFTVVGQPFFVDTKIPTTSSGKPDASYFAPDCFHFAEKAHEAAAIALWNNMLQPVGAKNVSWQIGEIPQCPTDSKPYLSTSKNSGFR